MAAFFFAGCGTGRSATTSPSAATQTTPTSTTVTAPSQKSHHRRHRRTLVEEEKAMVGNWTALGIVLRANKMYNTIEGDQAERRWRIDRVCEAGHCRMLFARATSFKPLVAPLIRAGDHWRATFDQKLPASGGQTPVEHSTW